MIFTLLLAAMGLGFLGSFHCIGMCGPIALSLPVQHLTGLQKVAGIALYNAGRIFTYALIGVFFGLIGFSFQYFGWQQWLSISLGLLLLSIFVFRIMPGNKRSKQQVFFSGWNKKIIAVLAPLFHKPQKRYLLLIGFLNGLLPCGLVYMAVAGALATGNIIKAAFFMGGFGAGTLPAMVLASYASGLITIKTRNQIRKTFPYMLALMGILLILRGMDLNIPFLSPHVASNAVHCH